MSISRQKIPEKLVVTREDAWENDKVESGGDRGSNRSHSPSWQLYKKSAQRKFIATVERIVSLSRRDSSKIAIQKLLSDPPEFPFVKVGPVIGKVTDSSARILIEISKAFDVKMVLEVVDEGRPGPDLAGTLSEDSTANKGPLNVGKADGSVPLQVQKRLEERKPAVFVFENLTPGTTYRVKLKSCTGAQPSSFRTFPVDNPGSLNFAAISCNKIFITQKEIPQHSDLWAYLAKAIDHKKVDMCLHLGDQIYGDGDKLLDAEAGTEPDDWSNCFRKSKALLDKLPKEQWNQHHEKVCESYREVYRTTWSHPPTAYCLANCPNLMIYDDHEIRDNWADVRDDWNKESVDFFIAKCAWKVNVEYQRQLHEDVNFKKLQVIDKDYHFHLIAGVGIMFLDIRGSRTFHRGEDDRYKYLGSKQWQDIKSALNGGMFEGARVLLLCTPAPLVFLPGVFTEMAAKTVARLEDFKGHWSAAAHCEEQSQMIDCLCEWKASLSGRDVLVLGGDVHCGGHSDIMKEYKIVFRQLTTSAIANHPLPKTAYYALRAAGGLCVVGKKFTFKHHNWTRSRNYGMVNINYNGTENPEVTSQLIKGKFMMGIREGVRVSNVHDSSTLWSCVGWRCGR